MTIAIAKMVIYTIIVLCVLIFVHEFGHFISAKLLGVKVNAFALGMGPALWKKQKGETEYSLRALPIGGYCAMEGEDEDSDDPQAFNRKPAWAKAIIMVAGSFMNLLLCVIIMTCLGIFAGEMTTSLSAVAEGSPAQAAGIQAGDRILSVDGQPVKEWADVVGLISAAEGDTVILEIERDGKEMTVESGTIHAEDGRKIIGITCAVQRSARSGILSGFTGTWDMTVMMYEVIVQLFTGDVAVSDLSGPVGIAYVIGGSAQSGFSYLIYIVAFISLNLAIMNMLPLPALDGGRLLFLIIRLLTGKAITDSLESKIHFAGLILLCGLMVYVTWSDITRFISGVWSI